MGLSAYFLTECRAFIASIIFIRIYQDKFTKVFRLHVLPAVNGGQKMNVALLRALKADVGNGMAVFCRKGELFRSWIDNKRDGVLVDFNSGVNPGFFCNFVVLCLNS
jgi:hypothetical protein